MQMSAGMTQSGFITQGKISKPGLVKDPNFLHFFFSSPVAADEGREWNYLAFKRAGNGNPQRPWFMLD